MVRGSLRSLPEGLQVQVHVQERGGVREGPGQG